MQGAFPERTFKSDTSVEILTMEEGSPISSARSTYSVSSEV